MVRAGLPRGNSSYWNRCVRNTLTLILGFGISRIRLPFCSVVAIPQKTAAIGIGIFSLLFLMWLLQNIFWWAIGSAGFLVGVHAVLRDASMHKDMDDAMAMEGDLNMNYGEESAFLGANRVV